MRPQKPFKDFDKIHRAHAGKALEYIQASHGHVAAEDIAESDHWPSKDIHFTPLKPSLSAREIRQAVYESPSSDEWQKFRVSLKGLTTKEKLYCLMWRWLHHSVDQPPMEKYLEIVRIQNYLGALVRGGQLDANWRISN